MRNDNEADPLSGDGLTPYERGHIDGYNEHRRRIVSLVEPFIRHASGDRYTDMRVPTENIAALRRYLAE